MPVAVRNPSATVTSSPAIGARTSVLCVALADARTPVLAHVFVPYAEVYWSLTRLTFEAIGTIAREGVALSAHARAAVLAWVGIPFAIWYFL